MTDDDIATARDYAEAYADFDPDRLRELLAPDLQFRQITPGGYRTFSNAATFISDTAEAVKEFSDHTPLAARAEPVGDRIATASRIRLVDGDTEYVIEHTEYVTVAGGRIVAIDGLCTGPRPV